MTSRIFINDRYVSIDVPITDRAEVCNALEYIHTCIGFRVDAEGKIFSKETTEQEDKMVAQLLEIIDWVENLPPSVK